MSKAKEAFPKARRGEDRKGPRQTGPKTKRDVSGVVVGVPANGWTPQKNPCRQTGRRQNADARRKKPIRKTGFDLRTESYKLFGVDLTEIPGRCPTTGGL